MLQALNRMYSIFPKPLKVGSEVEILEKTHLLPAEVILDMDFIKATAKKLQIKDF